MTEGNSIAPSTALVRYARVVLITEAAARGQEPRQIPDQTLPIDVSTVLRSAVEQEVTVSRYRKVWRLGGVIELPGHPGHVQGKVGYEDDRSLTSYDPQLKDFVTSSAPDGTAYPFVLDTATGRLIYQARESSGVLSALQALLNDAGSGRWRVQAVLVRQTWNQYRTRVRRVRRVRFSVQRPNPNYAGRPRLEEMMEGAHAGTMQVVMNAAPDALEGLDLQSSYIEQLLDHAQRGYGTFTVEAEVTGGEDQEVVERYDSRDEGAERVDRIEVDPAQSVPGGVMAANLATVDNDAPLQENDDDEPAADDD